MKKSDEIMIALIELIEQGNRLTFVCKKLGIHYQTFLNWRNEDPIFNESIAKAIKIGEQVIKEKAEYTIHKAFEKDFKAAAWLLERKYPKEYSTRQTIDMNTTEAIRENVSAMFPTEEELDALMKDAKNSK